VGQRVFKNLAALQRQGRYHKGRAALQGGRADDPEKKGPGVRSIPRRGPRRSTALRGFIRARGQYGAAGPRRCERAGALAIRKKGPWVPENLDVATSLDGAWPGLLQRPSQLRKSQARYVAGPAAYPKKRSGARRSRTVSRDALTALPRALSKPNTPIREGASGAYKAGRWRSEKKKR